MVVNVSMDCVFCRIIHGKEPSAKVYEDELVVAFLDINPINPGHTLVVPKRHVEYFDQLSDDEAVRMAIVVRRLAKAIIKAVKAHGYNILSNNGVVAGQRIPHLHIHIIPRFKGDGYRFLCKGKPANLSELSKIASKIRDKIIQLNLIK